MLILAIMLSSCAVTLQKTASGDVNFNGALFSKNAVTEMSGPAGSVGGIVNDSEAAAQAIATAYGVGVTVKGATKTAIASTNAEKAKVISGNKSAVSLEKIKVGGEVKKQALKIEP